MRWQGQKLVFAALRGVALALALIVLSNGAARAAEPAPAGASGADAPVLRVHHVPVLWAAAEQELVITATVEAAHLAKEIVLYLRVPGASGFLRVPFRRMTTDAVQFSATVPAEQLAPGVYAYYIAVQYMTPGSADRPHFASAADPHTFLVGGNAEARRRRRLLALHLENRSRLQAHTEYANFGARTNSDGKQVSDSYWRAHIDYTYRLLGWIYSIRLGAGLLLGQTYTGSPGALLQIPEPARCEMPGSTPTDCRVGMYYGFAELRFRLGSLVRLDLSPILGVGPQTFVGGAAGQLLVGTEPGSHVALGLEGVSAIGLRGWLRLAWDTVPHLPMAFILNIENFPNNGSMAMRLMMNFAFRFGRHVSADVTAGYATRGWQVGGPTLGGGLVFEF